jgi:hypothetical protein
MAMARVSISFALWMRVDGGRKPEKVILRT